MKSIFKKIAFVLALAMVVTAFPAKTAAAADEPWLKDYRVLYIGGDKLGDYAESAWASVKKGDYSVAFASEDETIATVNAKNGRLHAVSTGETVVTATFSKDGAEEIKRECRVVVKKNAAAATLDADSEAALKELTAGDEVELKAVLTDADGSNEGITDGVRFVSDNKEVVTVDYKTGAVKAVAAGTANISVYAIQWDYSKADKKYVQTVTTEKAKYEVVVKAAEPTITDAKLTSKDTVVLTVANVEAENLKDIVVYNENGGNITSLFKDPVLSEDKTTVTLVKYLNFNDKEKTTFAIGENTYEYTVSIGEPAAIILTKPTEAVITTATDIEYKVVDANGIDLGIRTGVMFDHDDKTYAVMSGNTITMYQVGKVAKVTATYNTGKYDADWNEIKLTSNELVITCVDTPAVTAGDMAFVVGSFDTSKLTTNPVEVFENTTTKLYVQVKLSAGDPDNNSTNPRSGEFAFQALTPEYAVVNASTGDVAALKPGEAKVLVTYTNGSIKTQAVATIIIKPAAKLSSVSVTGSGSVISNADVDESATIKVAGADQYGVEVGDVVVTKVEALSYPFTKSDENKATAEGYLAGAGTATLTFAGYKSTAREEGTYTYRITTTGDFTKIVSVIVKTPAAQTASYKVLVNTNSVEIDPAASGFDETKGQFTATVVGVDANGIAREIITAASATSIVAKVGDTELTKSNSGNKFTFDPIKANGTTTSGAIRLTASGTGYDVTTGTVTITCTVDGRTVAPAIVNVSLKKTTPTVSIKDGASAAVKGGSAAVETVIKGQLKVADGNAKYEIDSLVMVVPGTLQTGGTSFVLVKQVKVYETVQENVKVLHTIDFNKYFSYTVE